MARRQTPQSLVPRNARRTFRSQILAALLVSGCVAVVAVRRRVRHMAVVGRSMSPTLEPGDRLIAVRARSHPRAGDLAVTPDPRAPDRLLIKRVHAIRDGMVDLRGDHPASTDSRTFGMVPLTAVDACVVFRYHPPERAGRVSASRARER